MSDDPFTPLPPDWQLRLRASRRSACAEASFKAEQDRIWAMTVGERMILALELYRQASRFRRAPIEKDPAP